MNTHYSRERKEDGREKVQEHCWCKENVTSAGFDPKQATLIRLQKDEWFAEIDIVDGKLVYSGNAEISDAANLFFEYLAANMSGMLVERFGYQALRDCLDKARQ